MFTVGKVINSTHLECTIKYDLTEIGETYLMLTIGYKFDPKTESTSMMTLRLTDKCPSGYYCNDTHYHECPSGSYCPGGAYNMTHLDCPLGYFAPYKQINRCMPCLKGHFCPSTGLSVTEECQYGHICDLHKLTFARAECIRGHWCQNGTQADDPFHNGYFDNQTYHCPIGTYCRGGLGTDLLTLPQDHEVVVSECGRGMICPQGSFESNGVGECPAGHFCPHRNITGIPCPPRHYCPGRGNIEPIPCHRGTFNMHFGQQNCTQCPIGFHCPVDGLFTPLLCPPGYVCNDEGIAYPSNSCRAGYICLGGATSGLKAKQRSCEILDTIDIAFPCSEGRIYSNTTMPLSLHLKLDRLFLDEQICCKNNTWLSQWIREIGEAINQKEIFRYYADQVEFFHLRQFDRYGNPLKYYQTLDGFTLIKQYLENSGFQMKGPFYIQEKWHEQLIFVYIRAMYSEYVPIICPGGYLCLEGVNQLSSSKYYITKLLDCPIGSYCLKGAENVIGSGLCPIGFYCPERTEYPIQTPPGSYAGNFGSTIYTQCQPGTFQLDYQQEACDMCPSGYSCLGRGTDMPTICPTGNYRSVVAAVRCLQCPKGTFHFERGVHDVTGCHECPPGRTCEEEGLRNVTMTAPCTDGQVCFPGTGAKPLVPCPVGFFCPKQTDNKSMYKNQCMEGFFCRSGTGEASKTRDNCPQTYYCPPGTGIYDYSKNFTDYSNWKYDAPTRCPPGTGVDGTDTKTSLLQCYINLDYKLMIFGIDLRQTFLQQDDDTESKDDEQTSTETSEKRILKSLAPTVTKQQIKQNRRMLKRQSQINFQRRNLNDEVASKDDPKLKNLYEIQFEVKQSQSNLNKISPIRGFLNLDRKSLFKINPLNLSLCDEWEKMERLDNDTRKTFEPEVIFKLEPNSVTLITMDLRQSMLQDYNFVYGEDWAISISLENDMTLQDFETPIMLPEQFLRPETFKSDILQFQVLAWDLLRMKIDILIYNSLYINFKYNFMNTTSVEYRMPNRAIYNTKKIFFCVIVEEYFITLPFNQPVAQPDGVSYPNHMISFAKNYFDFKPLKKTTKPHV